MTNVYVSGADHHIRKMYTDRGFNLVENISDAQIVQYIGGADVDPSYYGEHKLSRTSTNKSSDERDYAAWKATRPHQMKIGICRGGQFLNVMNGGALWQHVSGHGTYAGHKIQDVLFKRNITVTSTHHQMMIPGEAGEVLAFAEGIAHDHSTGKPGGREIGKFDTEVVWYERTNSLCFQPHPEWGQHPDTCEYFFDLIKMLKP